jgi:hypothetical protein
MIVLLCHGAIPFVSQSRRHPGVRRAAISGYGGSVLLVRPELENLSHRMKTSASADRVGAAVALAAGYAGVGR